MFLSQLSESFFSSLQLFSFCADRVVIREDGGGQGEVLPAPRRHQDRLRRALRNGRRPERESEIGDGQTAMEHFARRTPFIYDGRSRHKSHK